MGAIGPLRPAGRGWRGCPRVCRSGSASQVGRGLALVRLLGEVGAFEAICAALPGSGLA
jgi:hypothetical protein